MGIRVDLELGAKWELSCIPMRVHNNRGEEEHPITLWDGVYYDPPATKACAHGTDVRTTAMKCWQGYKRTKQSSVSEKEQASQTFLNQQP